MVIGELPRAVPAGGSGKGLQAPNIVIVVHGIPGPVQKDGDAFFRVARRYSQSRLAFVMRQSSVGSWLSMQSIVAIDYGYNHP
jgi:hypothetical protein